MIAIGSSCVCEAIGKLLLLLVWGSHFGAEPKFVAAFAPLFVCLPCELCLLSRAALSCYIL